jgi:hypothetical protein
MSTKERTLQDIGRSAAECIADMVAALDCDYDRLAELRDDLRSVCDEQHGAQGATNDEFKAWRAKIAADENCGDYYGDVTELAELEKAAGDCESQEDAIDRIHEDPLSLELSVAWTPGETPVADKAILLLGTGGPAVRLIVELDDSEPRRAYLQVQDWGTPWTDVFTDGAPLLRYAQCFYYGEG